MIHARDFSLHYYGINSTDNKRTMFFFGEDLVYVTNPMLASGPDVLNHLIVGAEGTAISFVWFLIPKFPTT